VSPYLRYFGAFVIFAAHSGSSRCVPLVFAGLICAFGPRGNGTAATRHLKVTVLPLGGVLRPKLLDERLVIDLIRSCSRQRVNKNEDVRTHVSRKMLSGERFHVHSRGARHRRCEVRNI
jgi:hypothetical protein